MPADVCVDGHRSTVPAEQSQSCDVSPSHPCAFFLKSPAVSVGVVLNGTIRQRLIPEEMRGGVINAIRTFTMIAQVLCGFLAALLARYSTPSLVLVVAGIVSGIGVAVLAPLMKKSLTACKRAKRTVEPPRLRMLLLSARTREFRCHYRKLQWREARVYS